GRHTRFSRDWSSDVCSSDLVRALALCAVLALLAGCGRDDVRPTPRPTATAPTRAWPVVAPRDPAAANAVLMRAISLVGTPYRYRSEERRVGREASARWWGGA